MNILYLPTIISFLAFLTLGIYVFLKNRNQQFNRFFALGMGCLALMEFGNFMSMVYLGSEVAVFWKRISLVGESIVPTVWLAFIITFGRKTTLLKFKKWKLAIIGIGIASASFAVSVISDYFIIKSNTAGFLSLGGIGKAFYIFFLLCSVAIITNLEQTIRQTRGNERIKISSFIIGLGGLFAFLIFLAIQNLLFFRINMNLVPLNSTVFILCIVVITYSVIRQKLLDVNLYISRFVIYNSLILFIIGGYLLFVGLVSQIFHSLNLVPGYPIEILFLFVAVFVFFSLLLSDRVRWKIKIFINRHFYRSNYDYRDVWLKFSEGLSQKLDMDTIANSALNILMDSVGVDMASLWLYDKETGYFKAISSSTFKGEKRFKIEQGVWDSLIKKKTPCFLNNKWIEESVLTNREVLESLQPEMLIPLVSGMEILGLILIRKKKTGEKFRGDDIDILRSSAAQIASAIMNAKVSQELITAKELEVFHSFSSFLLHDLKNLVSSLSLILQNAREHMGNPEFQKNILVTIERSVEKMEILIAKLSNKSIEESFCFQETDLNELISGVVNRICMNGLNGKSIKVDLDNTPPIPIDREQIEKVIENFLINALEAIENNGSIRIKTKCNDDNVIFSVSDNGHGISREFLENSLFRPFKSSKKKGLGIGLYQCKSIIEAHQGRIEVETQEGVGSTFMSIIPISKKK